MSKFYIKEHNMGYLISIMLSSVAMAFLIEFYLRSNALALGYSFWFIVFSTTFFVYGYYKEVRTWRKKREYQLEE